MKIFRIFPVVVGLVFVILLGSAMFAQSVPEPTGWYSGDMHVHRSCGGPPESVSSMFSRMTPENLAIVSQLADSGNGEVQNATTDLPLVNGKDDPISQIDHILHWDAEWHWDAIYTQYPHQALGGHIVTLGLSSAQQLWQEYTFPILDWAHQHNGIAGFAHLQYLDGNGLPSSLTCCTPIEYPVEVALGAADFISEDVLDVNQTSPGNPMFSETPIQAYYKLLNSGFRPGLAAGTDYPCNSSDNAGALGGLLTYVQTPNGSLTYRGWVQGIASGRTVVSRNGHNEFLDFTVNGTSTPGDEVDLGSSGTVQVSVRWTAIENLTGTIQLIQNGNVIQTLNASVGPGSPATLTATVNFPNSGWLVARRMGVNPLTNNTEHYLHTAAVFVIVNGAPIRASASDAQYFVNWTNGLLQKTSPGGAWNSFFSTSLTDAQARYQAAKSLYQQVASEASGLGATLSSITVGPSNGSVGGGSQASFSATGTYSNNSTLNLTGQVRWTSSNTAVATISSRGLVSAVSPGVTTISAILSGISGSTSLTVTATPLSITTTSLPAGTAGMAYSSGVTATGGTIPYAWSIASGSLPTGLSLNSTSGAIGGTPTVAGTYNFTVQVADSSSPQQIVTKQLGIVIAPSGAGSCPCSIWSTSTVPGIADSGPDSAVELGVTFRADIDGFITGVRFYKGTGNTGTHVGNLWSSTGSLLGSATFAGETAAGWQQVNFASPVAVTANTTYVASYHTNVGHYSDDQLYFGSGVDNSPLHALADGATALNGVYAYGSGSSLPNQSFRSSNYWVDVVFTPSSVTGPPTVISAGPTAGATGVSIGTTVSATFNHSMSASSINSTTLLLSDSQGNLVPGTVGYTTATSTATLTPTAELNPSTTYKVTVVGGSGGVQDFDGNTMASDFTWSFTTGAAPPPSGPDGPILVISSVLNPFSRYYSEILSAEGLNEYLVADISTVTSTMLAKYDVAILGEMSLTSTQASMLSDWVNAGGHLIAMRPDKQLAPMLSLTSNAATLSNAYLKVQTASGPGVGIVGQTIQFHGTADLFTLNGATSIATLYSTASASTSFPAVSIVNVGTGQAAAFTYDLAKSVIYTRQGNPAWSGEKRDGQIPPTRSDDLYFGNASFDPQPDWVDLSKVAIPQADEQQRLLANLILQMVQNRKPLPRFWYLPSGLKAAVVMTGDDHAGGGTSGRFDTFLADSPTGCSVPDWQCVRSTSYIYPSTPISSSQVGAYTAQGFEVGLHVTTNCEDWTPSSLESFYADQLATFASTFPTAGAPKTNRTHCIAWSDYDTQPKVELSHGIRLDANYYYWPPTWVNDQPGMFTGSGIPMRFTDRNGNLIDVYQATTQMTDESGQSYPFNIDTLLTNAVGTQGFYGVFTANMHNDTVQSDGADAIVASAQSHGVPVVSALQMLTWLDGRNSSSFGSIVWSGNTLSFTITQGGGARNLQAMLPSNGPSGALSSITKGGNPVAFTTQTIKGVSYAMFAAATGSYQAVYGGTPAVVLTSISVSPTTVVGGTSATGTATLSGPAPAGGATVTLSSSNTAAAQTPANVLVPSGNTSATFTISTSAVSTNTGVTITGAFGSTQTATLTVTPAPVSLTSVTVNPTSVTGGSPSTGTVTLTGTAPTGGVSVSLQSSNTPAATVPASVTVPAGSASANFTITTFGVASNTSTTITATLGVSRTATLSINAATLSSITRSPTSVVGGGTSTGTVTLNGAAPSGGATVTLQSNNTAVAQVPASITVAAGRTSATFTITTSAVSANTSVTISGTYGLTLSTSLTVNAATLSSITRSPTSVVGGNNSTGTVNLNGAAPAGGAVVTLSSSNTSAAQVPASVTIPAGATSSNFTITTSGVASSTSVTITGVYRNTRTTTLTVSVASLSSLTLNPSTVTGGSSSTATLTLNGAAPPSGAVVTLSSSRTSAAQVPASATIPAGSNTTTFTVTTSAVHGTSSRISGTYRSTTRNATLTIQ